MAEYQWWWVLKTWGLSDLETWTMKVSGGSEEGSAPIIDAGMDKNDRKKRRRRRKEAMATKRFQFEDDEWESGK